MGQIDTLIAIPARLRSTRLTEKPLAEISGVPMIVHVWRRAVASRLGDVVVACDDAAIAGVVDQAGGRVVMTGADHPSGSDRVYEAVCRLDPERRYRKIVNLQGDLPDIPSELLAACLRPLADRQVDIATLAAEIDDPDERDDPNVVKVVGGPVGTGLLKALYFTRATAPWGDGPLYHHIGIYAYRREALERFVKLTPSTLERRERLEQLRALENGMTIHVGLVDRVPISVDTPDDLAKARKMMIEKADRTG